MNMFRLVKYHEQHRDLDDVGDGDQCVTLKYYPRPVNKIHLNFLVNYEDVTTHVDERFDEKIKEELDSGQIELI